MVDWLIQDMYNSLDNNCFLAALAIALMLPDICGQAEYPEKAVGKRYADWYDKYVLEEKGKQSDHRFLTGETTYKLRCSYLHSGSNDIEKAKLNDKKNRIDEFEFIYKDETETYPGLFISGGIQIVYSKPGEDIERNKISVYVGYLCRNIGCAASKYYKSNKEKFDFINFKVQGIM